MRRDRHCNLIRHLYCSCAAPLSASLLLSSIKCPTCRIVSSPFHAVVQLPKNRIAIELIESNAALQAQQKMSALPCQQCEEEEARQPAVCFCQECRRDYCAEHDTKAHASPLLFKHTCMALSLKASALNATNIHHRKQLFANAAEESMQEIASLESHMKSVGEQVDASLQQLEPSQQHTSMQLLRLLSGF